MRQESRAGLRGWGLVQGEQVSSGPSGTDWRRRQGQESGAWVRTVGDAEEGGRESGDRRERAGDRGKGELLVSHSANIT